LPLSLVRGGRSQSNAYGHNGSLQFSGDRRSSILEFNNARSCILLECPWSAFGSPACLHFALDHLAVMNQLSGSSSQSSNCAELIVRFGKCGLIVPALMFRLSASLALANALASRSVRNVRPSLAGDTCPMVALWTRTTRTRCLWIFWDERLASFLLRFRNALDRQPEPRCCFDRRHRSI
jgi:hypothetical protein